MSWLHSLFFSSDSVAHIMLLYAIVISVGLGLGRIKVGGISLGVTFVLFAGILAGHFGFTGTLSVLNFVQDFGLILFVYCIGLQVGPGFFESFKKGGVQLNVMALSIVLLNVLCCIGLYYAVFYDSSASAAANSSGLAMMVGVLCGAITNTPGLGAATEACSQVFGSSAPAIANGYACAYPLGVLGIIGATIALRFLCRISLGDEQKRIEAEQAANPHATPHRMTLVVKMTKIIPKGQAERLGVREGDVWCSLDDWKADDYPDGTGLWNSLVKFMAHFQGKPRRLTVFREVNGEWVKLTFLFDGSVGGFVYGYDVMPANVFNAMKPSRR